MCDRPQCDGRWIVVFTLKIPLNLSHRVLKVSYRNPFLFWFCTAIIFSFWLCTADQLEGEVTWPCVWEGTVHNPNKNNSGLLKCDTRIFETWIPHFSGTKYVKCFAGGHFEMWYLFFELWYLFFEIWFLIFNFLKSDILFVWFGFVSKDAGECSRKIWIENVNRIKKVYYLKNKMRKFIFE